MRIASFDRYDLLNNIGASKPAFTIWFAGCSAHCPNCHNPKLQDPTTGNDYTANDIVKLISRHDYMDIVLLGGEPLEQNESEISDLCDVLNVLGYRIWLYTGYELSDIPEDIVNICYFVKTGRYMDELKTTKFPASTNQKVFKRIDGILTRIRED